MFWAYKPNIGAACWDFAARDCRASAGIDPWKNPGTWMGLAHGKCYPINEKKEELTSLNDRAKKSMSPVTVDEKNLKYVKALFNDLDKLNKQEKIERALGYFSFYHESGHLGGSDFARMHPISGDMIKPSNFSEDVKCCLQLHSNSKDNIDEHYYLDVMIDIDVGIMLETIPDFCIQGMLLNGDKRGRYYGSTAVHSLSEFQVEVIGKASEEAQSILEGKKKDFRFAKDALPDIKASGELKVEYCCLPESGEGAAAYFHG
jgi:hypothetical protein